MNATNNGGDATSIETLQTASNPALRLPKTDGAAPWIGLDQMPNRPDEFSFVLLSDRTGLARPGVFEHAISITNLLRPDFALQVGDLIEGYTGDADELSTQWAELDGMLAELDVPLFHVPGNHDVSNDMMNDEWLRRYGLLHYHFVYSDTLFIVLNTQDPPQRLSTMTGGTETTEDRVSQLAKLHETDPQAAQVMLESMLDWNGTMPAKLGDAQLDWLEEVLAANTDVRWTVVSMHMPIWQDGGKEHPAWGRIKKALDGRRYSMFAGHVHNYRHSVIDGNDHVRLGPTGGLWVISGEEGNFDHVTLVTMTAEGPRIANIVLSGVLPIEGGTFSPTPRFAPTA